MKGPLVHQRKRGPGRCERCGVSWENRYLTARYCTDCRKLLSRERNKEERNRKRREARASNKSVR